MRRGWGWLLGVIGLSLAIAVLLESPSRWRPFSAASHEAVALLPGVTVEDAPAPKKGLIVTSLQTGSEAAQAGIQVGDDIEGLDGQPITALGQAVSYLRYDGDAYVTIAFEHQHQLHSVRLARSGGVHHGA